MAIELDYMEYATDAAAQAAYVTNDTGTTTVTQSNTEITGADAVDPAAPKLGQGFKTSTTDKVTKFTFQYKKSTGATGTLTGYIYDDNAGKPNAAVATFSAIAMADLTTSYADYDFTGTFTPVIGTQYHAVVVWTGGSGGDIWGFNINNTNPYANGVYEYYVTSAGLWTSTTSDFYFKIWQDVPNLQSYSEATIKTQGTYALKGVAAITSSLNKTLTRTIGSPIDLTGKTQIKFDIRSNRTGGNVKIGIHDSGGTTTEKTHTISSADTFETDTWDISGVADADKNAIDKIIVTVTNADAANTFYIDNFFFGGNDYVKTFDDDVATLSEVFKRGTTRSFAETATLSETFGRGIARSWVEIIILSEVFSKAITRVWNDLVTLTESYVRTATLHRLYTETVTLSEVAQRNIQIFITEAITLSEVFARKVTKSFTDNVTITEVFIRRITRAFSDTATLSDTIQRALSKVFIEGITISDVFRYWKSLNPKSATWTKSTPGTGTWPKSTPGGGSWTEKTP